MFDEDPAPDWSYWRGVPTVTLFEACALSLGADPKKLVPHIPGGAPSGILMSLIPPEGLAQRLDLAKRCLGETLPAAGPRYGEEHVRIPEFIQWAAALDWELPTELLELGKAHNQPAAATTAQATYRTGLAGRPTSWDLIKAECCRRHAAGESHPTTAEWARTLIEWLKANHPSAAQAQPKTMTNKLGPLLRELKANER